MSIIAASLVGRADAATESVLYSFSDAPGDGDFPAGAGLVADSSGNLYGTTQHGGLYNAGTVFKLIPPSVPGGVWTESVLYSFGGSDGSMPTAGLIMDSSGNLYGTTAAGGGINGAGTVFELTSGGIESVLYRFGGAPDGFLPEARLLRDSSGNLYGTTQQGGAYNAGTVFKLIPPAGQGGVWIESVLWSFNFLSGGAYEPHGSLVMDSSGNLYGTTYSGGTGGANGLGAVYKLSPPAHKQKSWSESVVHSFAGTPDGANPATGLVADSSGNFYGTTTSGGANGTGTAFKLKGKKLTESVVYSFTNSAGDGANPEAELVLDAFGNLYGTTNLGGIGGGTVFEVTPMGAETVLYSFTNSAGDGSSPEAGLVIDGFGNLYGTTNLGGAGAGTVLEVTP